jgi:hypothetical protein
MPLVWIVPADAGAALYWTLSRTARGRVLATCESLALTLEADSEEEAHSLVPESQDAFFLTLLRDGTLERFLHDRGWSLHPPPLPSSDADVTFRAPFSMGLAP